MKYNNLFLETRVSEIGLGTWQLGENSGWKSLSEKEASAIIHKSLDLGVNFFDTAPNYGNGTSEERLGKSLNGLDRNSYVINTKFGHSSKGIVNYDSKLIRSSLEGSLRRLRTDYVDSIILHNPPAEFLDGNKTDHYEILERLINEGKIKAYGASLDSADEMNLLMNTTNAKVIEAFFNILHQDAAQAFDHALQKQVGIIVKIPLDSGWLTGKYNAQSTFDGIRKRWSKHDIEIRAKLVDQVRRLLMHEEKLAQKAIAFCLSYEAVSCVIPGNLSLDQLNDNIESLDFKMPKETRLRLEEFYKNEVKSLGIPW